jgi:hypothetical protein
MITTISTTKVATALFEALKFGIEADHLGGTVIEINSNYLEKVAAVVNKVCATILSEEDVKPMAPYGDEIGGQSTYAVYRRMD